MYGETKKSNFRFAVTFSLWVPQDHPFAQKFRTVVINLRAKFEKNLWFGRSLDWRHELGLTPKPSVGKSEVRFQVCSDYFSLMPSQFSRKAGFWIRIILASCNPAPKKSNLNRPGFGDLFFRTLDLDILL